jgi:RND family efflux transporter MFP subunit
MSWIRGVMIGAAALAFAGAATGQPSEGGPPPAKVVVDPAQMERVEGLREVTGELRAVRRSLIAAEEAGRVIELTVAEGDEIESGGVIARLDDAIARLERDQAAAQIEVRKATVQEREADLEKTERDLSRLQELQQRSSASENEVLDAKTAVTAAAARLAEAEAELRSAEATLALAEERLDDMRVTAPFTGRVVTKRTEVGQWVREGDAVVELVQLDRIEAWLDVPERFVNRLAKPGATVPIRVAALGRTLEGTVAQIVPAADPLSRIFPVRATLPNDEGLLRPGMSATGLAPTGQDVDVLTVHKDAILRDEAGAYVFLNAGGRAMAARIEELFPVGQRMAIRSRQIEEGAEVVVEGNERLYPGQPLAPQPMGAGMAQSPSDRGGEG